MAGHIADSKNTNWCTTKPILDRVRAAFGGTIHLDPCSNPQSTVGALVNYCLPEHDGLVENWDQPTVYVNMPFGRSYMHRECMTICMVRRVKQRGGKNKTVSEFVCPRCERVLTRKQVHGSSIRDWVKRCFHAYEDGGGDRAVIGLMPAAVSTKHVQTYVFGHASAICYPASRIKFDGLPGESVERNTAPMDILLAYWGPEAWTFQEAFESLGHVERLDIQRAVREAA